MRIKNDKFIKQKEYYVRRMKRNGVEATVFSILKQLHFWEEGITFKNLMKEVKYLRRKDFTDMRVRQAISNHNKFGYIFGIYIKSDYGWLDLDDGKKKKEFRYFVPN
jgi:hypothetical protein